MEVNDKYLDTWLVEVRHLRACTYAPGIERVKVIVLCEHHRKAARRAFYFIKLILHIYISIYVCSFFKCLCFQIKSEVNSPAPCFELQLNCINPRNCQNLNHQLTLIGTELHIMINRNMLQEGEEELIFLEIYSYSI